MFISSVEAEEELNNRAIDNRAQLRSCLFSNVPCLPAGRDCSIALSAGSGLGGRLNKHIAEYVLCTGEAKLRRKKKGASGFSPRVAPL